MTTAHANSERGVLIVEDSQTFIRGLEHILQADGAFHVVGAAGSRAEAFELAEDLQPELALVGLRIMSTPNAPDRRYRHGVAVIADLKIVVPHVRILAMSFAQKRRWLVAAIRAGASGLVDKDAPSDEIIAALHRVAEGKAVLTADQLADVVDPSAYAPAELTPREQDVLPLLAEGKTDPQIAKVLHIEPGTVRTHVENIRKKLKASTRGEAVARAREWELL